MNALLWLSEAISTSSRDEFEGSKCEALFWETVSAVERSTGCDPVRAIRVVNEEDENKKDMIVISFSYFSIAVLGCFMAVKDPRTRHIIIVGQEEEINEEHLKPVSLLLEPLDSFLTAVCEYSIKFDNKFRESLNVPS